MLDIGGTHVAAALVDPGSGRVTAGSKRVLPLRSAGTADEILETISACASSVGAIAGANWGVAIPGPFDYARGIGLFSGVGKLESLYGLDVGRVLLDAIDPSPGRLLFLNDANAFLIGEWAAGAAMGHDRAVGVTLGTGVGSAFLARGTIVETGPSVPPEGRLDLLKIDGQPLEESVSRRAILRRYSTASSGPHPSEEDVRDIAVRALAGEAAARAVFVEVMSSLGGALAPWLERFDASILVIGGAIAVSWDLVAGPLRAGLWPRAPADVGHMQVVPAQLGSNANLAGAARHVLASALASDP